jgi:hypothetical protein
MGSPQKLFLQILYKDEKNVNLESEDVFKSLSFDYFLFILKQVYELDGHTKLQSKILVDYKVKIKNLKIKRN